MISQLRPEARRKADENRVEYGRTDVSLFHDHCTIFALTVVIAATAHRRHQVDPRGVPPTKRSFSGP